MYDIALEILNIIDKNGKEAYIIGGYPRDKYLGINSLDIDITTSATYEELFNIFENNIINKGFLSYRLIYKNYEYEITTYRKDIEYDKNRYPKVEIVSSLNDDVIRRDFVINTLCIDKNGCYLDLLNAEKDLDNKIIRCVGDTDFKIKQDILRSLRAIRFATMLNFEIDNDLKKSIRKYSYLITNLSKTRIQSEIDKILKNDNKQYGIELIKELGLEELLKDYL